MNNLLNMKLRDVIRLGGIVLVNTKGVGVGHLYCEGKAVNNLRSLIIKEHTEDNKVHFVQVDLSSTPNHFVKLTEI